MTFSRRSVQQRLLVLVLAVVLPGALPAAAQLSAGPASILVTQGALGIDSGFADSLTTFSTWLDAYELTLTGDLDLNRIPDADHAALLDGVLADASAPHRAAIEDAWNTNKTLANTHAAIILDSRVGELLPGGLDVAKLLAGVMTLGEPNAVNTLQAVLLNVYPGFTPDPKLVPSFPLSGYNTSAGQWLAADADLDGDGVSNIDEYRAAASRAAFVTAAKSSGTTASGSGPLLTVTSIPDFGLTSGTSISGTVKGLPGDGTASLVAYLSRGDGTFDSKAAASLVQTVSNGATWQYNFAYDEDPFAVKVVFHVVPVGTTLTACPYGCDAVPDIPESLATAAAVRAPLAPANPVSYTLIDVDRVGRGIVYALTGDLGYNQTGTSVTLWARPSLGWQFAKWWGDFPAGQQESDQITVVASSTKYLIAEFITEADAAAEEDKELGATFSVSLTSTDAAVSGGYELEDGAFAQDTFSVDADGGGEASYLFVLDEPGVFVVHAQVNAPSIAANSIFVNIDGPPISPTMIWDVDPTVGFQDRTVSWRGTGSSFANQFDPKEFSLEAGVHTLTFTGREAGVEVGSITLERLYRVYDAFVDFRAPTSGIGTYELPFNTMAAAVAGTPDDSDVGVVGGNTGETIRITKAMRIDSLGATVRVGDPGAALPDFLKSADAEATEEEVDIKPILAAIEANMAEAEEEDETVATVGGLTLGDLVRIALNGNVRQGYVYESVLPNTRDADGLIKTRADVPVAVRLRHDAALDPDSIEADVPGYADIRLEWAPGHGEATNDLWAVLQPEGYWFLDEEFSVDVRVDTADGEPAVRASWRFATESKADWDAREKAIEEGRKPTPPYFWPRYPRNYPGRGFEGELVPEQEAGGLVEVSRVAEGIVKEPLSTGKGEVWHIGPDRYFDTPQRVWVPVPEGQQLEGLELYYYFHSGEASDEGWYPASHVEGWMVPAPYYCIEWPGDEAYLGFLVHHGGIVQLGIPTMFEEDPVGLAMGRIRPVPMPRVPIVTALGWVVLALWLLCQLLSVGLWLNADALAKASRRYYMQLGLVLQNEDGPYFGKACWSGYYKDNDGVWQLDRRKNPDRRRLRVPTPAELDMRKAVRREIDRRIIEWGKPYTPPA